jgi:hypothetical protein
VHRPQYHLAGFSFILNEARRAAMEKLLVRENALSELAAIKQDSIVSPQRNVCLTSGNLPS